MKKNNAFCFIVNHKYKFALSAMIVNLQQTNANIYDAIVVYHDDLTESDCQEFIKLEPKIQFIKYDYTIWEKEHKPVETTLAKQFLMRYSHLAWSKYKILELLKDYKHVLYLDLDIIVRGDISELFDIEGIAWRNGDSFHKKFGSKLNLSDFAETKNISEDTTTPNGGLIYVSDVINWKKALVDGRHFLIQFMDYYEAGIDELVLAWITQKNNIPLTNLDGFTYNTFPQMYKNYTKIIHFMGGEKPWNSELMQTLYPEWMKYFNIAYDKVKFTSDSIVKYENPGKFITKKMNEQRWLDFLNNANLNIPSSLKLQYSFENEWLIFNFNKDIYYEFKFNQYSKGFLVAMWIKDKNLLADKKFRNDITTLVERNPKAFKIMEDNRGIYLYSEKRGISEIASLFDYFYQKTQDVINI